MGDTGLLTWTTEGKLTNRYHGRQPEEACFDCRPDYCSNDGACKDASAWAIQFKDKGQDASGVELQYFQLLNLKHGMCAEAGAEVQNWQRRQMRMRLVDCDSGGDDSLFFTYDEDYTLSEDRWKSWGWKDWHIQM